MQAIAPDDHSAAASVSSLCKLLFWHQHGVWQKVSLAVTDSTVQAALNPLSGSLHWNSWGQFPRLQTHLVLSCQCLYSEAFLPGGQWPCCGRHTTLLRFQWSGSVYIQYRIVNGIDCLQLLIIQPKMGWAQILAANALCSATISCLGHSCAHMSPPFLLLQLA